MPVIVLKNDFPLIAAELAAKATEAEIAAAKRMARRAQSQAPVRTGRLKASVTAQGNEVSTTISYSRFQEYGTSLMAAHPFFFEAVDRERGPFLASLIGIFRRYI